MFADIHHFVHISHHLPSYVTLTRLGNTVNNVSEEYSDLKTPQDVKAEFQFISRQDLNFSELFSFNDDSSSWSPEPSSPSAISSAGDRDGANSSEARFADNGNLDTNF